MSGVSRAMNGADTNLAMDANPKGLGNLNMEEF
jgi:hypothetical protein